jgi:hypothetical protein
MRNEYECINLSLSVNSTKIYRPTGRRKEGRPLNRLLDV